MSTGDQTDLVARLQRFLPAGWFEGETPIIDSLLQGPGWALSQVYALVAYAKLQSRTLTATGGWLDMIAADFFGPTLVRFNGQSDASFRARIIASVLRERATRAAVIKVLRDITGQTPILLEPQRPSDTGAWDSPVGYWDATGPKAGGWGLVLPYAFGVIAYRPAPDSQWDGVMDADIYAAVNAVRAAGITAWVQIQDAP